MTTAMAAKPDAADAENDKFSYLATRRRPVGIALIGPAWR